MPLLAVEDLNVKYGVAQVLWNITFNVEKGEILSLIGPNGAGKSTLLKSIIGIVPHTTGRIMFNSSNIGEESVKKRVEYGICYVPEGRRVFPDMTVLENIQLGALPKRARANMRDNIKTVFELFPILKERATQLAGTLSGGERQMLAIARALMSEPKLMMIDEPSLGLAPNIMLQVFQLIQDINRKGVTILLVEQNVRQTLKMSDRTLILENGRIVKSGSSTELMSDEYVMQAYLGI
ncbi:MAG: ABC transporter ATP-binding protein [Nitrososphaerales archaeon]